MDRKKDYQRNLLLFIIFICLIFIGDPVLADLELNRKEREYIASRKTIKAGSIDGGAPLHYRDSQGRIKGIAVGVLDEIARMTGLKIEYELYEGVEEAFASDADILFGLSKEYVLKDIVLSIPYLQAKTNLFTRTKLDLSHFRDMTYASIRGGRLPEGIDEDKVVYFNNREETLWAVEEGRADYGYGNEYGVAYYILQNDLNNIINIPMDKDIREYSIGFLKEDQVLPSIINKSISSITESQILSITLATMSDIESKISYSMVFDAYGPRIIGLMIMVMGVLLLAIVINVNVKNDLKLQNQRYELLAQTSNEFLFEYYVKDDRIYLSEKCNEIFGGGENLDEVKKEIKRSLTEEGVKVQKDIIRLAYKNGEPAIFRLVYSSIYDDKGKAYSKIGKLTDVSLEMAERQELLIRSQVDGLTGLYNAKTTEKLVGESLLKRRDWQIDAFIVFDCDRFKEINDSFGHLTGNQVLENIGIAMIKTFRKSDILGRVGGDEFAIYMKNIPSKEFVARKFKELSRAIQALNGDIRVTVSCGLSYAKNDDDYRDLFRRADLALYEAKERSGNQMISYQTIDEEVGE